MYRRVDYENLWIFQIDELVSEDIWLQGRLGRADPASLFSNHMASVQGQ